MDKKDKEELLKKIDSIVLQGIDEILNKIWYEIPEKERTRPMSQMMGNAQEDIERMFLENLYVIPIVEGTERNDE